jgi:hypothetical protein
MYADSDSPQVSEEGCDFSCSRFACYMITFPTSFHRFPPKIDRESFRIQSEQQLISGCSGFLQCSFEHGEVKCLLYTNLDQGLLQLKMQLLSMNIDPPPRLCLLLALPPSKPCHLSNVLSPHPVISFANSNILNPKPHSVTSYSFKQMFLLSSSCHQQF